MPTADPWLATVRAAFAESADVDPGTLARFDAAAARRGALNDARQLLAEASRRLADAAAPAGTETGEWLSTARTYVGLAMLAIGQAER